MGEPRHTRRARGPYGPRDDSIVRRRRERRFAVWGSNLQYTGRTLADGGGSDSEPRASAEGYFMRSIAILRAPSTSACAFGIDSMARATSGSVWANRRSLSSTLNAWMYISFAR